MQTFVRTTGRSGAFLFYLDGGYPETHYGRPAMSHTMVASRVRHTNDPKVDREMIELSAETDGFAPNRI